MSRDDCRKWKFETRAEAKIARRGIYGRRTPGRDGPLSIYRCVECDFLHLGHLPAAVRAGEVDRDTYREGLHVRD